MVKLGEMQLYQDGQPVTDTSFLKEVGGFSYFGDAALDAPFKSPYTGARGDQGGGGGDAEGGGAEGRR